MTSLDSFKCCRTLKVGSKTYAYYSLPVAEKNGLKGISRLPFSLKVLLENLLRNEDGRTVTKEDIQAFATWLKNKTSDREVPFRPARVLMQDFTGVPAVVDLAAMRDAMDHLGGDAKKINPLVPVDLVIDHSVAVNFFGHKDSFKKNVEEEYKQNQERYKFLKWAARSFTNFRVVPPGTGICHQVNLEYLSQTVWTAPGTVKVDGKEQTMEIAYPDTLVGTDSHTTMVNGLSVLGWGVGGIEAEAAMLGQPYSMVLPEVIGVKLTGKLKEGMTATDLVLTVTQMLRKRGVVGKFVEFFGPGLAGLTIADRATIGNMAPEYGATCGFFPIDDDTIGYLTETARAQPRIDLVAAYAKAQGMFRTKTTLDPIFTDVLKLELNSIEPSLAGPKRPQDRVALKEVRSSFITAMDKEFNKGSDGGGKEVFEMHPSIATSPMDRDFNKAGAKGRFPVEGKDFTLGHGDVVIAAITSCTNTSNPSVMVAAGLLARKAVAKGLKVKPWVKTSLAPGSQVVADYYEKSGLQKDLDALGFNLVGFGCTTCIGNSGPLPEEISEAINKNDLVAAAVLSGNRNFEGRVNADVRANYLASPPLVVAYAIAGSMYVDVAKQPLGLDKKGKKVFLKDIWPTSREINSVIRKCITRQVFQKKYANVFKGDAAWAKVPVKGSLTYAWDDRSTYVQNPPYFEGMEKKQHPIDDIVDARILGLFLELDHDRPHLAGRLDQRGKPCRRIPARPPGSPEGLQPVRHPARQSPGDDARHLRQHPHQEPDGARRRRRRDDPLSVEAEDDDVRRGNAIQSRRRAARRVRQQGIRHRLLARLGRQRLDPARHPRRDHAIVRAHPPLQPDRHGRRPTLLRGRSLVADAGAEGQRAGDDSRPARRAEAAPAHDGRDRGGRRRPEARAADLPHRHLRRAGILQERRHPAVRAAPSRGLACDKMEFLLTRHSPRSEWRVICFPGKTRTMQGRAGAAEVGRS